MIRVGVLGAGSHSQREHLPALTYYCQQHPGAIELTAICDRQVNVAAQFGFQQHCDSLDALLALRPDAIIAITPVGATAELATRILQAGIPLLLEKPLGRDLAEARQVAAAAAGKPAMVSMNRRFDPAIVAVADWVRGRRIDHIRATFVRQARSRAGFVEDVGLHAIDALRFIASDVAKSDGLQLQFTNGATGALELFPDGGHWVETYDVFGPGYHAQALALVSGKIWCNKEVVVNYTRPPELPGVAASGTYGETAAFLASVAGKQPFSPMPADVLASSETCFAVAEYFDAQGPGQPTS